MSGEGGRGVGGHAPCSLKPEVDNDNYRGWGERMKGRPEVAKWYGPFGRSRLRDPDSGPHDSASHVAGATYTGLGFRV